MRFTFIVVGIIYALALIIATLLTMRPAAGTPTRLHPLVVLMSNDHGSCTGFVVERGLIATAGHCIKATSKYQEVTFIDGHHTPYKIISYAENVVTREDWALVMADTGSLPHYGLDPLGVKQFSFVEHVGHPLGDPEEYEVFGMYMSAVGFMQIYASYAVPGESGSPVINEAGSVVGILTRTGYPAPIMEACTIEKLKALVDMLTGAK
jgi:hypothetical protein